MSRRSASIPVQPNPFWSDRAAEEHTLRETRPSDLPKVPSEVSSASEERSPEAIEDVQPTRGRSRSERQETGRRSHEDGYQTPQRRGAGGSGAAASSEVRGSKRTQEVRAEQLQRDLEKEVVDELRKQNSKLLQELEILRGSRMSNGSWSEVSEPRAPTHGSTPKSSVGSHVRYTPGGTRIPDGSPPRVPEPPPPPPLPPLPMPVDFRQYEPQHHSRGHRDMDWQPTANRQQATGWVWGGAQHDRQDNQQQGGVQPPPQQQAALHAEQVQGGESPETMWWTPPREATGDRPRRNIDDRLTEHDILDMLNQIRQQRGPSTLTAEEAAENDRYWNTPVQCSEAHGMPRGDELREGLRQTAQRIQGRMYTQAEVDEMMTRQREGKERDQRADDGLRSFQVTFPDLPEASVKFAALEAGDWLTQIRPLINDVSHKAAEWWSKVEEATEKAYKTWLAATPMQKLKVEAPDNAMLSQGNERLAQRVGVLLMQALPKGMKQELIATRQLDAPNILFKVYKTFQPGGLAEKREMLAQLVATKAAQAPSEAVEALRLWKRQSKRAMELKASLPDPVLQVKALMTIMEQLLSHDAQASFRVSAHRMEHGIDTAPSQTDVSMFYDLLLAEAEHMTANHDDDTAIIQDTKRPTIKAMQASPGKQGRFETACHWWGTEGGCKAGKNCRYTHDWQSLADKSNRCWICSATTHRKHECPALKREEQLPTATGGSGGGNNESSGKGFEKGKKGKKGKGREGKTKAIQTPEATSTTSATAAKGEEGEKATPAVRAEKGPEGKQEEDKTQATGTASGQESLMTEVTSLLRSLRVQGPQMRACHLRKIQADDDEGTLLDGGATHCMRQRTSEEEWQGAEPVTVRLATGEVRMRQDPKTGTLLVEDRVQPIIPVAKLIEVGYVIYWSQEACKVEHPRHGKIPVVLRQGCPTVGHDWGNKMMKEVEDFEARRARIRAIMSCGLEAEGDQEKEIAALQAQFPEVPLRILERIPGEKNYDADQVPFNRRRRRHRYKEPKP